MPGRPYGVHAHCRSRQLKTRLIAAEEQLRQQGAELNRLGARDFVRIPKQVALLLPCADVCVRE